MKCPNCSKEDVVRKGRAHYECPKCGDVTLLLVLLTELEESRIKE